jgi:hypothetical protein
VSLSTVEDSGVAVPLEGALPFVAEPFAAGAGAFVLGAMVFEGNGYVDVGAVVCKCELSVIILGNQKPGKDRAKQSGAGALDCLELVQNLFTLAIKSNHYIVKQR